MFTIIIVEGGILWEGPQKPGRFADTNQHIGSPKS